MGGWNRPKSGWSPPLEERWAAMAKNVLPFQTNSPTSGTRDAVHAADPGSIRAGEAVRCTFLFLSRNVSAVMLAAERSTNCTPRSGRNRKATRMLPPGSPPSALLTGLIWRYW